MSHIAPISAKAGTTIPAYRVVRFDTAGSYTAQLPSANTVPAIGITTDTVLDTTGSLPVAIAGVAKLYFNDTASSGSLISWDSSGRGIKFTATTAGAFYIGMLIGPAVTATGTEADVLIQPGFQCVNP